MEFSFQSVLGIDLDRERHLHTWRWFETMLVGLLSTDTPLYRYFNPPEESDAQRGPLLPEEA